MAKRLKNCLICGEPLPPKRIAYCSDFCRRKKEGDNTRSYINEMKRCAFCGEEIPEGRRGKYCSDECAGLAKLKPNNDEREQWNPNEETYAQYQMRTYIHPQTRQTLADSVRIAPIKESDEKKSCRDCIYHLVYSIESGAERHKCVLHKELLLSLSPCERWEGKA